jgi:hypothetical protein
MTAILLIFKGTLFFWVLVKYPYMHGTRRRLDCHAKI